MTRVRVLVVDDFPDAREMYRVFLTSVGFEVVEAANGLEAIKRAGETLPDVILMDIALPVMDGITATRRLKADSRTAAIPVVALSGHDIVGIGDIGAMGWVSYLTKPCLPEDVLIAIRNALPTTPIPPVALTRLARQS